MHCLSAKGLLGQARPSLPTCTWLLPAVFISFPLPLTCGFYELHAVKHRGAQSTAGEGMSHPGLAGQEQLVLIHPLKPPAKSLPMLVFLCPLSLSAKGEVAGCFHS